MSGVSADAKAKKPKLSRTKVSVTVGKTKKVTVKNAKKVTWKVTKKAAKIVKLTKKSKKGATIKGLKKGTAKISVQMKNGKKKVKKKQPDAVEELSCSVETIPAVIEEPPKPQKALTELQTIRVLSNKMESVEQVADAEGMLSEVESAADAMIYRLDVCFEHYPEFLKNPNIRQKVVELLQKAKEYMP